MDCRVGCQSQQGCPRATQENASEGRAHANALLGNGDGVVRLVPLTEGCGIDLNNAVLDDGVGADELVVGGVVDDTDDTRLAGRVLGAPGKVARLKTESTVLLISSTGAHAVSHEAGSGRGAEREGWASAAYV